MPRAVCAGTGPRLELGVWVYVDTITVAKPAGSPWIVLDSIVIVAQFER